MTVITNMRGINTLVDEPEPAPKRKESEASKAAREDQRRLRRAELHADINSAKAAETQMFEIRKSTRNVESARNDVGHGFRTQIETCQTELTAIEDRQVEAIANGRAADPEMPTRRAELRNRISELKSELQDAIAPYERKLEELRIEHFEAKRRTGYCQVQFELIALGRRDLLAAMHLTLGAWRTAMNKLEAAKSQRARCAADDTDMCEFWDAQLTLAEMAVTETKATHDAALQAVYDE